MSHFRAQRNNEPDPTKRIALQRWDTSVVNGWLEAQKDLRALNEPYSRKLKSELYR
jgi:hypothetical protein